MLNILAVLQQLSVKINLEKVDSLYPNHPKARVEIKDEARMHATPQEVTAWLEQLSEYYQNGGLLRPVVCATLFDVNLRSYWGSQVHCSILS